ncbi:MAG: hypothetical protein JXA08_04155 [Methanomicrobiaceae archaeon]|nr:hypothetical protein [Methanomicrobiaceae archaeon]
MNELTDSEPEPPHRQPAPAWVRSSVYAAFLFSRKYAREQEYPTERHE